MRHCRHCHHVGDLLRKLQYAIPDEGAWGEKNNYEIFVKVWQAVRLMVVRVALLAGRS